MQYLEDVGVDLESAAMLVPLEIMQVPTIGQLTKKGFVDGWKMIG
jgi:DCN1-like protein 1/2